jgi:type VI secretion system protein ImpF
MKLIPNLIERLRSTESQYSAGENVFLNSTQARESVAFDLEALMNSRTSFDSFTLEKFPLASKSVVNFGIPDFSSMSLLSGLDRDRLCRSIASAVEHQDRRMRLVSVSIDTAQNTIGKLSFIITAALTLSGVEQPVRFSADFDQRARRYVVGKKVQ